MLVSEIATRVKRQFGDEVGAQITDEDIIRWINDAQRELAVSNDLLQTTATTAIKKGQDQYHLPPDILQLRSVRVAGRKLAFLSPDQAAEWTPNLNSEAKGKPTHFTQWSLKIDLYPTPDYDDANDLQLYYTRNPLLVKTTTDTPELPQQYHNRIVDYCIAQAHELDDNMESYRIKMEQFTSGAAALNGLDQIATEAYSSISVTTRDTSWEGWDYG